MRAGSRQTHPVTTVTLKIVMMRKSLPICRVTNILKMICFAQRMHQALLIKTTFYSASC
jgi:hypothetical protein